MEGAPSSSTAGEGEITCKSPSPWVGRVAALALKIAHTEENE